MGKQPNCVLSLNSDVKGCISVRQSWPKPYLFKTSAPNYLFTCFFNWRRWGNYFLTKLHVGIIVKKQHNTLLLTLQEWMWEIQQERPEYSAGGHECTLEESWREEKDVTIERKMFPLWDNEYKCLLFVFSSVSQINMFICKHYQVRPITLNAELLP